MENKKSVRSKTGPLGGMKAPFAFVLVYIVLFY